MSLVLMDLTCPVEFASVEVLRDSGGRAQAYLTFRNLSDEALTELHAMVTMLDDDGGSLGIRPLRYRSLDAQPHAPFTLCMVMDDLPFFQDARITIQRAGFAQGGAWEWNEDALRDCTPKALAPGPQRVALVAVAGPDAICWPERRDDVWVCVCGRFNLRTWRTCRRCRRNREETFAHYQLDLVVAQYRRQRDELATEERTRRAKARVRERDTRHNREEEFARSLELMRRRRVAFWMALVAVLLIAWGGWSMLRSNRPAGPSTGGQGQTNAIPTMPPAR